jgi:phage gp36-like protein
MKSLLAPTEDFIKVEHSWLALDATKGTNVTLTLANNDHFAQNEYIVIGEEGSEVAELCQINAAVSGATDVRVAALKFDHKAGTPVTKYRYNQRKFYGATSAIGTYTELTTDGSPVTIQVDDPMGSRLEYTGIEGYLYFKSTYFNSQTNEETDIAQSDAVLADESVRYCSLYAIRKQAHLTKNTLYPEHRIELKRKQAEAEIKSAIFARYLLPLSEIPQTIAQICELLAAGYLEYEEFGAEGNGGKKLGEARAILKRITDGKMVLLGSDNLELARVTKTGRLDGYPNDTGTDAAQFSMADKY